MQKLFSALKRLYADNIYFRYVLLTVPIFIYLLPLLLSGNKIAPGDVDYNFQLADAFRRTVLEFRQFPWWNPWVAGGTPLYANAQFGLISLQSLFVLPFGAVIGFKLAIVGYYLIGFFGFRALFTKSFQSPDLKAILLAYIWTFGTFLGYRVAGGHYTFLLVQYFPWAFYFYRQRHEGKNWLYLSLVLSLMLLSAPHYMTIMSLIVLVLFFIFESIDIQRVKDRLVATLIFDVKDIKLLSKVLGVVIILSAHRLYYAFSYLADYPRSQLIYREVFQSISLAFHAIAWPFNQVNDAPFLKTWSWLETSAYIGVATFTAFIIILLAAFSQRNKKAKLTFSSQFTYPIFILLGMLALFFVTGLGEFNKFAPFYILRRIPFFESLRVSPRWFVWVSVMILFVIATYKGKRHQKLINILLVFSCIELFFVSRPLIYQTYKYDTKTVRSPGSSFEQQRDWKTETPKAPYDKNLLEATHNNYGQIIADDPLIDTRFMPTLRCDVDEGCPFVSDNAKISYWSPNKIILRRVASGPIYLNMNPGQRWMVNEKYIFIGLKTVDPTQPFIINDANSTIIVQYAPKFSLQWLKARL